eukprot:Hpha_TRINITY_DN2852_c0_g1::TRINITY_DN2852_c0_g1_i1::g.171499::m.171499
MLAAESTPPQSAPAQAPSPVAPATPPAVLVDASSRPWKPPSWLEEEERQRKAGGAVRRSHSAPMDSAVHSPQTLLSGEGGGSSSSPDPPPPPVPALPPSSAPRRTPVRNVARHRSRSVPDHHSLYFRYSAGRIGPPQRSLRQGRCGVGTSEQSSVAPLLTPSARGKTKRAPPASRRSRSAGTSLTAAAENATRRLRQMGVAEATTRRPSASSRSARRGSSCSTRGAPSSSSRPQQQQHHQPDAPRRGSFLQGAAEQRAQLLGVPFRASAPSGGLFAPPPSPPRRCSSRGNRRRSRGSNCADAPKPTPADCENTAPQEIEPVRGHAFEVVRQSR